jgi:hypothetical protein
MSNDNEQIIEDVEEKDLVENQELEAEGTEEVVAEEVTTDEVSEEIEVTEDTQELSDAVLEVLLGEAKKKNEAEESEEESEVEEDEELEETKKDKHEGEDQSEEEEVEEAYNEEEEDEVEESTSDDEEEAISSNQKDLDKSTKEVGKMDNMPEVTTKAGYLAAAFGKLKEMKKSALVDVYSSMNPVKEGEEEEVAEMPKLKADLVNSVYEQLKGMKKEDLVKSYKSISSPAKVNEDVEADHFAEDLKVLAEAEQDLTEDFKEKASILFEGAVANKVAEIKESLEAEYSENLQEEVTYVRESLVAKIDDYLSYVVESWIEENQEFVDNKLRTEIAENFMKALQNTFTEHYIEVPDGKVDLVDELAEECSTIKESLANAEAEKAELSQKVEELSREKIISEASVDLASTQAAKLENLLEEVKYEGAESFETKVATIKESFFNESTSEADEVSDTVDTANTEIKTIVEGEEHIDPMSKLPADMAKYVSHLSRFQNSPNK